MFTGAAAGLGLVCSLWHLILILTFLHQLLHCRQSCCRPNRIKIHWLARERKWVTLKWGEIDNIYPLILASYPLLLKGFPQINRLGLILCIKTLLFHIFVDLLKSVMKGCGKLPTFCYIYW